MLYRYCTHVVEFGRMLLDFEFTGVRKSATEDENATSVKHFVFVKTTQQDDTRVQ